MKKKKKLFIIIGSVILFLLLALGIYFIFFNADSENKTSSGVKNNTSDKIVAPASNTEELVKEMNVVETKSVNENEIVFSDNVPLKDKEKVAVWIYSEPKFLGYFEVLIENGTKKIIGLKEALENISIEIGKHNIAITTEKGEPIGYINVNIKENGKLSNNLSQEETKVQETTIQSTTTKAEIKTTTKEVTETVDINFETTKQNEVNMLKGTTSVVQEGQKGQKTIIYKVTYDSNGKEISKEKKSEKVTKEPINRIEKVGTSDFNMNKDMLTEISSGPVCAENQLTIDSNGFKECNNANTEYYAIKINTTYYITSFKENGSEKLNTLLRVTNNESPMLVSTYNGIRYYFYMSAGGGQYELLNEETCTRYNLKCGRW